MMILSAPISHEKPLLQNENIHMIEAPELTHSTPPVDNPGPTPAPTTVVDNPESIPVSPEEEEKSSTPIFQEKSVLQNEESILPKSTPDQDICPNPISPHDENPLPKDKLESTSSPIEEDSKPEAEQHLPMIYPIHPNEALEDPKDSSRTLSSNLTPQKRKPPNHVNVRRKFFNSGTRTRNPYRTSLEKMKKAQKKQLEQFRKYANKNSWQSIHHDHYDWFMFPIEDGSQYQYNVLEDDVKELLEDSEWLAGYKEGVQIVSKAWGWDIDARKTIEGEGIGWTGWDVRLAKMIRSLWIFGIEDYKDSLQNFAWTVKPTGGLSYGYICLDEVLYM
jgi:hypothetical protein